MWGHGDTCHVGPCEDTCHVGPCGDTCHVGPCEDACHVGQCGDACHVGQCGDTCHVVIPVMWGLMLGHMSCGDTFFRDNEVSFSTGFTI